MMRQWNESGDLRYYNEKSPRVSRPANNPLGTVSDKSENTREDFDANIGVSASKVKVISRGDIEAMPEAAFSRKEPASSGLPKASVEKVVNALIASWKNAPKVIVVNDMNDDAYDSTEAYDYLSDRIRNGDRVLPYEAEEELKALRYEGSLIADGADELTEDEINGQLQQAGNEEREGATNARVFNAEIENRSSGSGAGREAAQERAGAGRESGAQDNADQQAEIEAPNNEQESKQERTDAGTAQRESTQAPEQPVTGIANSDTGSGAGRETSQERTGGQAGQDLLGEDTRTKQALADAERAKDAKRNTGEDNQADFTLSGSDSEFEQARATGAQDLKETDSGNVVMFSRSQSTQQKYEQRIDALFEGDKPKYGLGSVVVLDKSDMLDLLGFGNKSLYLNEGKVIKGKKDHPNMTADVWKKIPEWIENPAIVFDSDDKILSNAGRLVFVAPEQINNNPVFIIVEPSADAKGLEVNLLINAYDKDTSYPPFKSWIQDKGLLRYYDKWKSPKLLARSGLQLSSLAQARRASGGRIYQASDLVKCRSENEVKFSRSAD